MGPDGSTWDCTTLRLPPVAVDCATFCRCEGSAAFCHCRELTGSRRKRSRHTQISIAQSSTLFLWIGQYPLPFFLWYDLLLTGLHHHP